MFCLSMSLSWVRWFVGRFFFLSSESVCFILLLIRIDRLCQIYFTSMSQFNAINTCLYFHYSESCWAGAPGSNVSRISDRDVFFERFSLLLLLRTLLGCPNRLIPLLFHLAQKIRFENNAKGLPDGHDNGIHTDDGMAHRLSRANGRMEAIGNDIAFGGCTSRILGVWAFRSPVHHIKNDYRGKSVLFVAIQWNSTLPSRVGSGEIQRIEEHSIENSDQSGCNQRCDDGAWHSQWHRTWSKQRYFGHRSRRHHEIRYQRWSGQKLCALQTHVVPESQRMWNDWMCHDADKRATFCWESLHARFSGRPFRHFALPNQRRICRKHPWPHRTTAQSTARGWYWCHFQ